jgi:hypothetical protein
LIHKLAEDFDWGLSSVLLLERHVEIVNKNDGLHTEHLWSKDTSAALVRFLVNNTLDLIGASLSTETDLNNVKFLFRESVQQYIVDVHTLSRASWADEQGGYLVVDAMLLDVRVTNRINSRHYDVLDLSIFRELVN